MIMSEIVYYSDRLFFLCECLQVVNRMESSPKGKNFDRRMTGASVIDDAINEVEVTFQFINALMNLYCSYLYLITEFSPFKIKTHPV